MPIATENDLQPKLSFESKVWSLEQVGLKPFIQQLILTTQKSVA